MSTSTDTTWTCDRCHFQTVTDTTTQPVQWIGVADFMPPKSGEEKNRRHFCRECADAFRDFLYPGATA